MAGAGCSLTAVLIQVDTITLADTTAAATVTEVEAMAVVAAEIES
jgi:hypothetical protein